MTKRTSHITAFLIFSIATISAAQAQPTKTLALPTGETIEYVEVRDEPRHRHKFENERVRLYDVLIPPGDTTLYHRHSENTVYVIIQGSRFRSQLAGGPPVENDLPLRAAFFETQAENPIIHQVSNIGDRTARLIGVEIYEKDETITREPFTAAHSTLPAAFDVFQSLSQVRIYRVYLAPGQSTGAFGAGFSSMMIFLNGGKLSSGVVKPGDYQWSDGTEPQTLTNVGDTIFLAVLYELP